MIYPIYLLGTPELREETKPVGADSAELQKLIDDMVETMHGASGIGLAAPQIGRSERLFVVDVTPMSEAFAEEGLEMPPQPMTFLNPVISDESEETAEFEEGCLSLPELHEAVVRPESIRITYRDRYFEPCESEYSGMLARVIQHELDHLDGVLFIDHLTPLRRRLLKRRLEEIRRGDVQTDYEVVTR